MNLSFENNVALVTGAAAGMGLATAKAFAQAGAAVVLAEFKEEVVRAEAKKLTAAGYKAMAISGLCAIHNPRAFSLSN